MDCTTGKISYENRKSAVAFAKRSKRGAGQKGAQPYHCQECGYWHMGRRMSKVVQRSRRRYMEGRFEDERNLDRKETP